MDRIFNNPVTDSLGFITVISSVTMSSVEMLSAMNINDTIQSLIGIGGLVFLFFKIKNSRIDYKIKKRDFDNYTKEKEKND